MGGDQAEGGPSLSLNETNRRFVLHFTAKHVLLVRDEVANVSTEFTLNALLARTAWGTLDVASGEWILMSDDPSTESTGDGLISYDEFLHERFHTSGDNIDEDTRADNLAKVEQKLAQFTTRGEPGAKFRPFFEQAVKCLTLPKGVAKAFGVDKVILNESGVPKGDDEKAAIMRFGRYQVVPAFWNMIIYLAKEKREFDVVLRGSREELALVVAEWNFFCEGSHPCYSGANKTKKTVLDGSKGSRDMRLQPQLSGEWVMAEVEGDTELVHVLAFEQLNKNEVEKAEHEKALEEYDQAMKDLEEGAEEPAAPGEEPIEQPTRLEGIQNVYSGLNNFVLNRDRHACAITDAVEGEPMTRTVPYNTADVGVHSILFVRDLDVGDSQILEVCDNTVMPPEEAAGSWLCSVDSFKAITDPNYFIKAVTSTEAARSEQILRKKQQEADDKRADDPLKPLTPEQLRECPPKEYLYHTVIPALLPALEIVQRDRPADPLTAIAMYMLRHGAQYSKTLTEPQQSPVDDVDAAR